MSNLAAIIDQFTLSATQARDIAGAFAAAMDDGLAGRPSSLKMLPSYLSLPTGDERGVYLALDFGGSNVRVQEVELLGGGRWHIRRHTAAPLRDPAGAYDHTVATATAEELFAFIAGQIAAVADPGTDYLLGHTFSFPCRQTDASHAELLSWTKEIKTAGVEGREVNGLLAAALERRGLGRIKPVAVINDTVGTLLAAAYCDLAADIAAICGTGHNTCYYDASRAMIINMESGNFDRLPLTPWDDALDAASERPGAQRLEKAVAGRYLGELVRRVAAGLGHEAGPPLTLATEALVGPGVPAPLREIAAAVFTRSARLVAATFGGVLASVDPAMSRRHTIAVDGSLYEKTPGYPAALAAALAEILGAKADLVSLRLVKDGSGAGAAIAAAVTRRQPRPCRPASSPGGC